MKVAQSRSNETRRLKKMFLSRVQVAHSAMAKISSLEKVAAGVGGVGGTVRLGMPTASASSIAGEGRFFCGVIS